LRNGVWENAVFGWGMREIFFVLGLWGLRENDLGRASKLRSGGVGIARGEGVDDVDGFEAYADDLGLRVLRCTWGSSARLWVAGILASGVGVELVLIDDPFEGGAVCPGDYS